MPTTITFESTLDDVAAVAAVHARRTGARRREWIPPAVVAAFCLFVAVEASLARSGMDIVVGSLLAAPAGAVLVRRVRAAALRRALGRAAEAAGVLGHRTVTLGPDGIAASTAHGENVIRWDAVEVVRTDRHLLLFGGHRGFGLALPVSALGDAAGVDRVLAEIERHRADARR